MSYVICVRKSDLLSFVLSNKIPKTVFNIRLSKNHRKTQVVMFSSLEVQQTKAGYF